MTKVHKEYNFNGEKIAPEKWGWGVLYKDNTELHQFDEQGNFHQFKEIDMPNAKMFTMYKLSDLSRRIDMVITEGMQFFHFYRNVKPYYANGFVRAYVFGWKKGDVTSYNFILPDNRVIISSVDNVDLVAFNI